MAKRVLGATESRRRRHVGLVQMVTVLTTVTAFLIVFVAASSGVLAPSGFEGNDGNMVLGGNAVGSPLNGTKDWANVNPFVVTDGSGAGDVAITGGANGGKEDVPYPFLTTGNVPPKNDLLTIGIATENVGGDDFLYASSIRAAPNGSANLNFELNKGTGTPKLSPNGLTPTRVAGDKLLTFDFTSGGTKAEINLLTWKTSGTCLEAPAPPCWGDLVDLDQSPVVAEGAANDGLLGRTGAINAAGNTLSTGALAANVFQEMSVNLTDANILPAAGTGACATFAYVTTKSRTSGNSFLSSLKDINVANRPISNCGSVVIRKTDDLGNPLSGVEFKLYKNEIPLTAPRGAEDVVTDPLKSCTTSAAGTCTISDVFFGNYWVVETAPPPGHTAAADQAVSVINTTAVELTFVNVRQPGSISIHKADDAGTAMLGVRFNLYNDIAPTGGTRDAGDTATALFCTTDALGDCTIANVPLGQYWVVEDTSTVPTGYSAAADQHVTLTTAGGNIGLSFVNPRTHRVIVIVCHEGTNTLYPSNVTVGSTTKSSITSGDLSGLPAGTTEAQVCNLGGTSHSFRGLGHETVSADIAVAGH